MSNAKKPWPWANAKKPWPWAYVAIDSDGNFQGVCLTGIPEPDIAEFYAAMARCEVRIVYSREEYEAYLPKGEVVK